jgi:hypothetical protein
MASYFEFMAYINPRQESSWHFEFPQYFRDPKKSICDSGCCIIDLEGHNVYESDWPLGMFVEEWSQEIPTSGY